MNNNNKNKENKNKSKNNNKNGIEEINKNNREKITNISPSFNFLFILLFTMKFKVCIKF